ncbi:Hsp20/alpha crystallin family protein [Candidatus Peregrinibacteria bacterium]|nr:Hsp20/alpha crystallin family protein [Candidatus Peregrinibacteria bacterium]
MKTSLFTKALGRVDAEKYSSTLISDGKELPMLQEEKSEGDLAMDIYETSSHLIFLIPIAGVSVEAIHIEISEDILSITGERKFPENIFGEEKISIQKECFFGKFSRSVILPEATNSEDATARFMQGMLCIEIPKAKKVKLKQVHIENE